jgi:hypothetical protein
MRRVWLGLLLCACSGSSDNEVDATVPGFAFDARDALFFVHNGRQLVVVSDQDNTCRKLTTRTIGGQIHLLEMYIWNATAADPTSLIEGTYDVDNTGTLTLESQGYFATGTGCSPDTRWFRAGAGRVIVIRAGDAAPGEREQVAFRLDFGDNVIVTGHADATFCNIPDTGVIPCINEGNFGPP